MALRYNLGMTQDCIDLYKTMQEDYGLLKAVDLLAITNSVTPNEFAIMNQVRQWFAKKEAENEEYKSIVAEAQGLVVPRDDDGK
jgi:hypothetical protein